MLPLQDLHAQLDEGLNINSSQSNFSTLLYTDLINAQRELWVRNEYNKNRSIDPNIQQTIPCAELELVNPNLCCVAVDAGCKVLRTVKPIPNTIEFNNWKGITSVGPSDILKPRFSFIDYARAAFIGEGKTTKNSIYTFLYEQYLYVISNNPLIMNMKYINIRGIFFDPTSLSDFINCEDKPCYSIENDAYPLNQWMWEYMKPIIIQELSGKRNTPLDDSNNNKDDQTVK